MELSLEDEVKYLFTHLFEIWPSCWKNMVVNVKFQHCLSQNVKDDFDFVFVPLTCSLAVVFQYSVTHVHGTDDDRFTTGNAGDRDVVFVVYNILSRILSHSFDVLLNVQAQMSSRCINMCLCHDKDQ